MKADYKSYLKSPGWKEIRREKVEESGGRCEICGSNKRLQVHHKDYSHLGRESEAMWTLQVLCQVCHEVRHDPEAKRRFNNYADFGRVFKSPWLDRNEKLVMLCLIHHRNSLTGMCCPGQKKIGLECGFSQVTAGRVLNRLKARGFVCNKAKSNQLSKYLIVFE